MLSLIIKQLYVLYKTALLIPYMWVKISESIYAHAKTFVMNSQFISFGWVWLCSIILLNLIKLWLLTPLIILIKMIFVNCQLSHDVSGYEDLMGQEYFILSLISVIKSF